MFYPRRSTLRVNIPNDIGPVIIPLLDRLLADDADGMCLQTVIRPYFVSERPLVLILRGATTCLYVEGPWYTVGDRRFPLGAQLQTEFGWFDLSPVQAADLIRLHEEALDAANLGWLTQENLRGKAQSTWQDRNREVDDPIALRQMAADANDAPPETGGRRD